MARRKRIDGEDGLKQIVSDAALPPEKPPEGIVLSPEAMSHWEPLYKAKARRAWRKQDLYQLANACRALVKIEEIEKSLSVVSMVEDSETYNRLYRLLDVAVKQYRMLCVYLQIHPEATQGKSEKQVKQNQAHSAASDYADGQGSDDLIARPTAH